MNNFYIDSPMAPHIIKLLEEKGVTSDQLYQETDIRSQNVDKISYSQLTKLFDLVDRVIHNPAFWLHLRADAVLGPKHFVIWLVVHSPTLRESFAVLEKYGSLISGSDWIQVRDSPGRVILSFRNLATPPSFRSLTEGFTGAVAARMLHCQPHPARLLKVTFQYPQPDYIEAYRQIFKCPLEFDCNENAMHIDSRDMSLQLTDVDPYLYPLLKKNADEALAKPNHERQFFQIKAYCLAHLDSTDLSVDTVSQAFHLERTTLNRRLKQFGYRFLDLRDECRQEMFELYSGRDLPMADIPHLLGYCDASSLRRAIKRWSK